MDFWRRSARIYRKDKIKNNIIKQKMNVRRSLVDDITTKQLQWSGHVSRMEGGRLPKEVMKWRPPGRRKRGRPKHNYICKCNNLPTTCFGLIRPSSGWNTVSEEKLSV